MLKKNKDSEETIALVQSEDMVAGTAIDPVVYDETMKLGQSFSRSQEEYEKVIKE
jgi:hypothetical protein